MQIRIAEELEQLQALSRNIPYADTRMLCGTSSIPGAGFFPCAWGSMDPMIPPSQRPIMVLGQDQDRVGGLALSMKKGNERYSPTWKNMEALFKQASLPLDACFYTNFIMGARQESSRNTGPSPALAHPAFMRGCAAFFLEQLKVQKPQVIITLGMIPFQLLSLVSTDLRLRAVGITEFKDIGARDMLINADVVFDDDQGTTAAVVPICHPCQPQNSKKRVMPDGIKDEVGLLRKVVASMQWSVVDEN